MFNGTGTLGLGHQVCLVEVTEGEGECRVKGGTGWESMLDPQSWIGTSPEVMRQVELRVVCSATWEAAWRWRAGSG